MTKEIVTQVGKAEKIVTQTGIKIADAGRLGLTVDLIAEALTGMILTEAKAKKDMPVGVWVSEAEVDGLLCWVYTSEEVNIEAGYAALSEDDKRAVWEDGYKRRYVNKPNHDAISVILGLKEEGKHKKALGVAQETTARETRLRLAIAMAKQGLTAEQICQYTGGDVSLEVAATAVKLIAG